METNILAHFCFNVVLLSLFLFVGWFFLMIKRTEVAGKAKVCDGSILEFPCQVGVHKFFFCSLVMEASKRADK